MVATAQTRGWTGASRRREPRFRLQSPLDVTVSRAGTTDVVPGRALNVCERGIGAVVAGELLPGETVSIELRLQSARHSLKTRAIVRYQDKLRCGLEFSPITPEQKLVIEEWARNVSLGTELKQISNALLLADEKGRNSGTEPTRQDGPPPPDGDEPSRKPGKSKARKVWVGSLILIAIAAGIFWWKWDRDWQQLEGGLTRSGTSESEEPQAQVPAEEMQRLLVHRVDPVYPTEARKQNLQGVIALDIVVGRDGSVVSMRALNGPAILSKAAMDALRWWKFEPYRLNGVPAVVETTVAVEFKKQP